MLIEDKINNSLVLQGRVGTFYRKNDLLMEHEGEFLIVSMGAKGKVDIIRALSEGQRRSLPTEFRSMRDAVQQWFNIYVRMKTSICIQNEKGHRTIVA